VETRVRKSSSFNIVLGHDMYKDGYENITNVDYSSIVINQMKERYSHMTNMKWLEMDIRDLKFKDGEFDIVIDKATLDALLVSFSIFL
jgi:ubiquinone/menaquinone biosynthesis C-methylase UbiE